MLSLVVASPPDDSTSLAVGPLLDWAHEAGGGRCLNDDQRLALAHHHPGVISITAFMDSAAAGIEHSQVAGYAQVGAPQESPRTIGLVVGYDLERWGYVADALVGEVMERLSPGDQASVWITDPDEDAESFMARHGFSPNRDLLQMRCLLPPPAAGESLTSEDESNSPATASQRPRYDLLETRPFVPGSDNVKWLELNSRAFARHPEQGAWTESDLVERLGEPWFDPEGFLLHYRDERLAAACWTKVHTDHAPELGEIYVVCVDPDFQGLGLGRAITLSGLAHLARNGVSVGMLYVESDNETALAMYRSMGFKVHSVDRAYSRSKS